MGKVSATSMLLKSSDVAEVRSLWYAEKGSTGARWKSHLLPRGRALPRHPLHDYRPYVESVFAMAKKHCHVCIGVPRRFRIESATRLPGQLAERSGNGASLLIHDVAEDHYSEHFVGRRAVSSCPPNKPVLFHL